MGLLAQGVALDLDATVSDLLGVTERRSALAAIEAGDVSPHLFDVVGADWDVEERAVTLLRRFGLPDDLDRTVGRLSGGEVVRARLVGLLVDPPSITLLDEPTNDLDADARALLTAAVDDWPGTLVVVSHDRELLEHVDRITELRAGATRTFTGGFSAYTDALDREQQAARRQVRAAEGDLRRQRRELADAQVEAGPPEAVRGHRLRQQAPAQDRDAASGSGRRRCPRASTATSTPTGSRRPAPTSRTPRPRSATTAASASTSRHRGPRAAERSWTRSSRTGGWSAHCADPSASR